VAEDFIGMDVTDTGVADYFKKLVNIDSSPQLKQAVLDASVVLEKGCKDKLREMVYDKPQGRYKRKMGAGLFGATKASGKINIKHNEIKTGVLSNKDYAVYIMFGTGIYAKAGKGRKTRWLYRDDDGNFHWTVGQHPKPYMTEGAQKMMPTILKVMTGFLPKK